MKSFFLIPFILLVSFSSCKKDDNKNSNCDKTVKAISGSYSIVKFEYAPTGGSYSEKPVAACMVDDKLLLKSDGTTQYTDAGVSCGQNLITGSWSISADGKITINAGPPFGLVKDGNITLFDCSSLVITTTIPGQTLRVTLTK